MDDLCEYLTMIQNDFLIGPMQTYMGSVNNVPMCIFANKPYKFINLPHLNARIRTN